MQLQGFPSPHAHATSSNHFASSCDPLRGGKGFLNELRSYLTPPFLTPRARPAHSLCYQQFGPKSAQRHNLLEQGGF